MKHAILLQTMILYLREFSNVLIFAQLSSFYPSIYVALNALMIGSQNYNQETSTAVFAAASSATVDSIMRDEVSK